MNRPRYNYEAYKFENGLAKAWVRGVPFDDNAYEQVEKVANLPFIHKHVAIMPDVHWGQGSTIGSVIPTKGAIIPAAVGVDIGCGMYAIKTNLTREQLPSSYAAIREAIENAVPHGRTNHGGKGDKGAWHKVPELVASFWNSQLRDRFYDIVRKRPQIGQSNSLSHLGTLGTGNHFIELCFDEKDNIWIMLHTGSRGVGNKIASVFISEAKAEMKKYFIKLDDPALAYFVEGTSQFDDYINAVNWAQYYAVMSREIIMAQTLRALDKLLGTEVGMIEEIDCHHNFVEKENHFGANIWVTRKGATRAREGEMGIIPGSMGAKSYIVKGKGNPESFNSCSHGAGRVMGRREAERKVSLSEHEEALKGVECRVGNDTIDETPSAYKDIDKVIEAQSDLIEVCHTLKQVVCVKG
jgi:tRNA-splicing ligase RtcB